MSPPLEDKSEVLPPNFVFSSENEFYYGPATCGYMHYRTAILLATVYEHVIQGALIATGYCRRRFAHYVDSYHELHSLKLFVLLLIGTISSMSLVSTFIMMYGLKSEQANLLRPKLMMQAIQITFLLAFATIAILAMCVGLELTNELFEHILDVTQMERDMGPIWPFNVSVLAFMAAALGVWIRVVSGGAYEYLLDKEYFATEGFINIELRSRKDE